MIEIRWLEREVHHGSGVTAYAVKTKVLQYRHKIPMYLKSGNQYGGGVLTDEWSDWQDIPTVTE